MGKFKPFLITAVIAFVVVVACNKVSFLKNLSGS